MNVPSKYSYSAKFPKQGEREKDMKGKEMKK